GRAMAWRLLWRRGQGQQGERDRCWRMTDQGDGWLCGGESGGERGWGGGFGRRRGEGWAVCRVGAAVEKPGVGREGAAAGGKGRRGRGLCRVSGGWVSTEQRACTSDVGGAVAAGKQAVMADAVEAFGQDVGEEPADELVGVQCHRLPPVGPVDAVILPAESDAVVVGGDQSTIGDGDAVGIAG